MLESLINPKRAEKGPWKMFFIGLLYATAAPLSMIVSGVIALLAVALKEKED